MTIPIANMSTHDLPMRGGVEVTITGVFSIGVEYRVYLGPNGDNTDSPCYGGVSGLGYSVFSYDGLTLEIITPPLDRGIATLSVYGGGDSGSYPGPYGYGWYGGSYGYGYGYGDTLLVLEDSFLDLQWQFIKNWPSVYDTTARDLSTEPRQDT